MDNFYDLSEFNIDTIKEIMVEANELSFNSHVDKLDCSISPARQSISMKPEEAINTLLTQGCHIVFIKRCFFNDDPYFEVGFSTFSEIPHYLFLNISVEHGEKLIKKYNIQKK